MSTPRIHRVWAARVAAEYGSAGVTAGLLHQLILIGAPDPLVRVTHRVVTDELDHALLCHEALRAYGGASAAVAIEPSLPPPMGSLEELLPAAIATIVRSFCFGETLAVPLFAAMRKDATGPARDVLDRVVRDEAVHSKLGWDALDWLLEGHGDPIRTLVSAHLPAIVEFFEARYGRGTTHSLTPVERAAGLITSDEHRDVLHQTVQRTILPRLESRGIATMRS